MKILKIVQVFIFICVVPLLSAQTFKFGHIDSQKLVTELPEFNEAQKQLEAEATVLEDRRNIMQEEVERKFTEYISQRDEMPDLIRATMEKDIQDLQQRLESYNMLAQQSLAKKQQDLLQPIIDKVNRAIEQVGDENGFIYIFDVSMQIVLYYSTASTDCMQMVKQKLGVK
ncbi:MAG: OmpH family outer membrane protein [Marinilabiliaceae bacterium]|nr:OmpH family outer membrane protein [Marinilabiliaceae bacterium]